MRGRASSPAHSLLFVLSSVLFLAATGAQPQPDSPTAQQLSSSAAAGQSNNPRALHWSLYVQDLLQMIRFAKGILGMRVLRSEDNDFKQRTYVGYGPEHTNYALELIADGPATPAERSDHGTQRFVLRLPNAAEAVAKASREGWDVDPEESIITGPCGYRFQLLAQEAADASRSEPFEMVVLRASDPAGLANWYRSALGLRVVAHHRDAVTMAVDAQSDVLFHIERATEGGGSSSSNPGGTDAAAHGGHALVMPAGQIRAIGARAAEEDVVHPMGMELEGIGMLFSLSLRDPAGHHVRIVSSETFDKAAVKYSAERDEL
jgi:catechol 2,3-dioxygenase-like lactoylglutathione lyase family enzyme